MKIRIFAIEKSQKDEYESICEEFCKMSRAYAQVETTSLFNNKIAKAQKSGKGESQGAYAEAYKPFLSSYSVALDVGGKESDSFEFAKMLRDKNEISFFIGGAYGFGDDFLKEFDKKISLSRLTFGHKVAKVVLLEQIYRGLAINNNHPYHK